MSDQHVAVTLVPLLIEPGNPIRSLAVTLDNGGTADVCIGRCSKREIRKRTPATDNTWFDSRVMSRDHCTLVIDGNKHMTRISDMGSTHGTFVNGVKLLCETPTPLYNGDIIRFGVNVDRGQELFQAIEVRYTVEWPKFDFVTTQDDIPDEIPDLVDLDGAKPAKSPSTNTFSVPEDDDESEIETPILESDDELEQHAEDGSDDSKESDPRSWDSIVLQPTESSSVSSVEKSEAKELKPELGPGPREAVGFNGFLSAGAIFCNTYHPPRTNSNPINSLPAHFAEPLKPKIENINPLPTQIPPESIPEEGDKRMALCETAFHSSKQNGKFPEACYQAVPEDAFSNWTMMRPMFMRIADMAWGESDHIPDVDYERRVIHAARRCSLSRDDYLVDDSPDFQPMAGTEIDWTIDPEESDTSFHRVPGQSLRYWSVDKRRYWIFNENIDGQEIGNWWWIVEKPWGMISDEVKEQLATETEIKDCHKCWIVRSWEPQHIGETWWELPPYWNPDFDEELPSDEESVDSNDEWSEEDDSDYSDVDSDAVIGSELAGAEAPSFNFNEISGINTHEYFSSGELSDGRASSEGSSDVGAASGNSSSGEEGSWDYEPGYSSYYDEHVPWYSDDSVSESLSAEDCADSEDSEEDEDSGDDVLEVEAPPSYTPYVFGESTTIPETQMADAGPSSFHNSFRNDIIRFDEELASRVPLLTPLERINNPPVMNNPGAKFPGHTVPSEIPKSFRENTFRQKMESSPGPARSGYKDGPFSLNTDFTTPNASLPLSPPPTANILKRSASDMEAGLVTPDSGFSQDAQRVSSDAASQVELNTISSEVSSEAKEAIASALAENAAAVEENDRPAKRVKSSHTPSKSLASHATTAVVGALLGGLGTIAMLAALPNEYFA